MEICEHSLSVVVYTQDRCPLCVSRKALENSERLYKKLETENDRLEAEIYDLKKQNAKH